MEGSISLPDGEVAKVECGECGATYDEDMHDCPICGASKRSAKRFEEVTEEIEPSEPEVTEVAITPSEVEEEATMPRPRERLIVAPSSPPLEMKPEEDKELEREKLYKSAFAEVDRDWVSHQSKLSRLKLIASVEKGILHASLIITGSNLLLYLISIFLYASGAMSSSFWEIYLEIFSIPYLFMALLILIILMIRTSPGITAEEDPRRTFLRIQLFAFIVFLPPFIFVMFNIAIPIIYGSIITFIFLGIGAFLLWKFILGGPRDFPLWFSTWIAGLWLFIMVQAGVVVRNMLVSGGGVPFIPIAFGYYIHYGIYDIYLLLISTIMVGMAFLKIRPMYVTQDSFDSSIRYAIEFYLGRAHDAALTYFNRAIRIGEDIMKKRWKLMDLDLAWMGRGACELEKGLYDEAVASLRMALKLNPANDTAWNLLGIVLSKKDDPDGALDAFKRAIEINPRYSEAYNNVGNVLYLKGDFKQALKYYDAALDINKKYKDAWINKGYTYLKLGLHKDAIRCSNEAMKLEKGAAYG